MLSERHRKADTCSVLYGGVAKESSSEVGIVVTRGRKR